MKVSPQCCSTEKSVTREIGFALFFAACCCPGARAAQEPATTGTSDVVPYTETTEQHMPEAIRKSIRKVVVVAGESPTSDSVTGTYDKETAGLIGGMSDGSRIGTISKEIGGVPVNIPIPVLGTLGAIYGGITGVTKREIQEFRDALTKELVDADSPPLRNDGLALDVFWGLRKLPDLESELFAPTVDIPNDTDAVLYVSIDDLTIDVQGKDAVITATAVATVRRLKDNWNVYETTIQYQDTDTLSNWTDNDNALWRDYTNFARYYLGRATTADIFGTIDLNHELQPVPTDSAKKDRKNQQKYVSNSQLPTLAWELELEGDDVYGAWTESISEADIHYDIEIFDNHRLVYDATEIPDPQHTVEFELEACTTYRWSVRPAYHLDGATRFGDWMTSATSDGDAPAKNKGVFGRRASEAPAYTQDFPVLEIACRR